MNCPRKIFALGLAVWLTMPAAAWPQGDPRARIRTTVELVVVPVTVKDKQGNLIGDLRQDEFRVLEDGVEQQISLFTVEPFPLSAVVLLDNDMKLKAAQQVESSLQAITGAFSESDEVALVRFDTLPDSICEFTSDGDKLFKELKRLKLDKSFPGRASGPMTAGPRVNTAPAPGPPNPARIPLSSGDTKNLDDAVYAAGQLLRARERDRRKIIYLISDGRNSRHNSVSFDDVVKLLLSADISVYAIGVGDAVLNRGPNVLSKYARATGGDVFYALRRGDLESLYARATEEARHQYTLAYAPQKTDRAVEYHSIEVRIRRPHLNVQARDGYYATPKP